MPLRIKFVHICENAFYANDRKLNAIGIFDLFNTNGLPFIHGQFFLTLGLAGIVPDTGVVLNVISPSKEAIAEIPITPKKDWDPKKNTNLIFHFTNTVFKEQGRYAIVLKRGNEIISPERDDYFTVTVI